MTDSPVLTRHAFNALNGRRVSYTQASLPFAGGSLFATRHDGSKDISFYFLNADDTWEAPPHNDASHAAQAILRHTIAE